MQVEMKCHALKCAAAIASGVDKVVEHGLVALGLVDSSRCGLSRDSWSICTGSQADQTCHNIQR